MTSLCDLSRTLPQLVANLLDREDKLQRGRFREETLTDIFTAALAAFAGPQLVIEYPPEADTGGDIDIDFHHISDRRYLPVRIQAKRLNGSTAAGMQSRSYKELLHKVSGAYQYETLTNKCTNRLALYMFYNHGSVVRDPYYCKGVPQVSGINLAFALDIKKEMDAKVSALPKLLHHKRLSHLRQHFFELDSLLCPSCGRDGDMPTPSAVSESLRNAWRRSRSDEDDLEAVMRHLLEPETGEQLNPRRLPDGPAIRLNPHIERPLITFLTGRTEDDRTPRITDQPG